MFDFWFYFHELGKTAVSPGLEVAALCEGILPAKSFFFFFEVAQSCPTHSDPMDCSPPRSSVHGTLQARILQWVAISFSRASSWPRDQTQVSYIAGWCFDLWATREVPLHNLDALKLLFFHCVPGHMSLSQALNNIPPQGHYMGVVFVCILCLSSLFISIWSVNMQSLFSHPSGLLQFQGVRGKRWVHSLPMSLLDPVPSWIQTEVPLV